MKLLSKRMSRYLVPFSLIAMILYLAVVIAVQAGELRDDQTPPTTTPAVPPSVIESPSDNVSIFLPAVAGSVQPTKTPKPTPVPSSDREFFISPGGNDNLSGTSPGQAWATFDHAWTVLAPGDTLTLLDGVYYQALSLPSIGTADHRVTIRAQNDGKAILDGEYERIPLHTQYGSLSYYYIIEGIVGRNSSAQVFKINGQHTILRRVSGYNGSVDENSSVFSFRGRNNLLEDCVAAGTGRKMIVVFGGQHNTIRRCFTDWRRWDGRNWGSCWPWGDGLEFYNSSHNVIENSISYGQVARTGVSLLSQGDPDAKGADVKVWANDNKILGTMSILAGMNHDGTPIKWADTRPQPTKFTCVREWERENEPGLSGFWAGGTGRVRNNLLQDILAWGNARHGISFHWTSPRGIDHGNNHVNRATILNNGLDNVDVFGGIGVDAKREDLEEFTSVENGSIGKIWEGGTDYSTMEGEGARLTKRYVDGVLTDEPLWPWPMEERIKDELGYSVTCVMGTIINDAYAQGKAAEGIDMNSRDPDWASDPDNLVAQACNN